MSAVEALRLRQVQSPSSRDSKAFAQAYAHSARVRFLKIAIPLAAIAAVGMLLFIGLFDPFRKIPKGLSVDGYGLDGTKITMEQPKLSGFHKDGRPYLVWAKSAQQDLKKQNIIELTDMQGTMSTPDGAKARVSASSATYDTAKNTILMRKDVLMHSDSGFDLRMKEAFVDFGQNSMVSNDTVSMQMKTGSVLADSMHLSDNGKVIVFEGHVQSTFSTDTSKVENPAEPASKDPVK